jgi:hypothetical protein
MKSYKGDPKWIRARFNSTCRCGKQIRAGEDILYWPYNRSLQCHNCGEPAWQRFLSEAADEDVYNGSGNPYAS